MSKRNKSKPKTQPNNITLEPIKHINVGNENLNQFFNYQLRISSKKVLDEALADWIRESAIKYNANDLLSLSIQSSDIMQQSSTDLIVYDAAIY